SDVVSVVRRDGEILARLPGFSAPLPPFTRATRPSFFAHVDSGRARALYRTGRVVALRAIPGFPVFATVARDGTAISARFWRGFAQQLSLGVPAILLVAAMALYASRRVEERDRVQSDARFHLVFDSTPVGLAVISAETERILSSNEALAKLVG